MGVSRSLSEDAKQQAARPPEQLNSNPENGKEQLSNRRDDNAITLPITLEHRGQEKPRKQVKER